MESRLFRLIEPTTQLDSRRKVFSNASLMRMVVPLFFEQLLTIVIRFVLSVILGIWMDLGVIGIAAAMCCDWMVRAVLFLHRFRSGKWKECSVIR